MDRPTPEQVVEACAKVCETWAAEMAQDERIAQQAGALAATGCANRIRAGRWEAYLVVPPETADNERSCHTCAWHGCLPIRGTGACSEWVGARNTDPTEEEDR